MSDFVIIADANCDLNKELRERFAIADYVPSHVVLPDGSEQFTDMDWQLYKSPKEFYEELRDKKKTFSTAIASTGEVRSHFEPFLKEGKDILYITISGGMSGTYNVGLMVKKELEQEYPGRTIEVIDSLRYSVAIGMLNALASSLRSEGKSLKETVEHIESVKNNLHQMGPMDDLFFLARKGRISKGKAFMGQLIGIKPLGDFNLQGMTTVLGKAKGKKAALDTTIEYMRKTIVKPEEQIIWLTDTNRPETIKELKERIEKEFHPKEIIYVPCGPACGVNIGPGLAAAYYFGTPITEGSVEEQKLMDEILGK